MRYTAMDPGKCTGWATWDPDNGGFNSGEVKGKFEFRDRFDDFIAADGFDEVTFIIEDFLISSRTLSTKIDYNALRIIGYTELECERLGYTLYFQRAAQIKNKTTIATDTNLKKIGWYRPGHGGHANDSARHLLIHIRNLAVAQPLMKEIARD